MTGTRGDGAYVSLRGKGEAGWGGVIVLLGAG